MMDKVILVFKTHFDIGFTELAEKVLDWYAGPMLDDVLKTCRDTADMEAQKFVWTMPAMPLCEMLKRSKGGKYEELTRLIAERRIVWHALPFTSHMDFCGVEEMVRGFAYSEKLCRQFNRPRPVTAKMSDVPGHGRILPSLLTKAGIRFLHLGSNEFAMSPNLPPLFFWEGPDRSRILTMYSPGGYGAARPPEGWEFPVWISFQHTHDNLGPQTADSLRKIVEETQTWAPGAEVVSGTMEDFYHELMEYDLSRLPVIRMDLADSWIHGVGSYPAEVAQIRAVRRRVMQLEASLALLGVRPGAGSAEIAAVYEQLNRFGEHTWGLDVKTWLPAAERVYEKQAFRQARLTDSYRYMEESWNEQRTYAEAAGRLCRQLEKRLNESLAAAGGGETVLNAGGSSFTGWVRIGRGQESVDTGGEMALFGETYRFAEEVPALSLSPLPQEPGRPEMPLSVTENAGKLVAQNHRYRITVSAADGMVEAVYDRKLKKTLLAARGKAGVFAYHYDKYGSNEVEQYLVDYCQVPSDWGIKDNGREAYPDCERETFTPVFTGWDVSAHSLELSYQGVGTAQYGDAAEIKLVLTLPAFGDELFVELILTGKQESPYIESGSLLFPFSGDSPVYRFNKNGQILNPETDIADYANHVLYCLEAFAAMEQEAAGVCIVTHDTPLAAIGETGIYTFRKGYERHEPVLHFNLFNNMWGTNFPQWTGGDLRFRYTVFGYQPGEPVMERGLSLYQGVEAVSLPPADNPFILPTTVQVLAFIPEPSGGILRLRDTSGVPQNIELRCRAAGSSLQECDLYGRPLGGPDSRQLVISAAPYDIRTFRYKSPACE